MSNTAVVNGELVNGFGGSDSVTENISETTDSTASTSSTVIAANSYTDSAVSSGVFGAFSVLTASSESVTMTDSLVPDIVYWLYESISAQDTATTNIVANQSVAESMAAADALSVLITQLISEAASGSETWYLEISTTIADVIAATGVHVSSAVMSQAIAEAIVAIEVHQSGLMESISDSAGAAEIIAGLVEATQAIVEQAIAADAQTSYLFLFNTIEESTASTEAITIWQSLTQYIEEGATAFVQLSIGGEVYTGWVMNTANGAVSEYQGMDFNSLCKIGNRYFGALDTGVYELTGTTDAGTGIHTYIQSGLVDFGSTHKKGVSDAYIAADADGRIALGVAVSEKTGISRYWYEITPSMAAIDNIKIPIGKGLRGRYWKFDVASESMSEFDAITVLPYVLTRRV